MTAAEKRKAKKMKKFQAEDERIAKARQDQAQADAQLNASIPINKDVRSTCEESKRPTQNEEDESRPAPF